MAGAACALALTPVAEAGSSSQPTRLVTFVALTCPSYTDIAANRARNNIQESLQDLGADTLYNAGDAVSPAIEQAQQPDCTPLPDWRFTMGNGYKSRAVVGPWGALSVVTGPFAGDIVTKPSVPLLDRNGDDTGETLAGAVTMTLTPEQAALAAKASSLWAQGGTPTDPVLNQQYPGTFGFGALRCAVDALNGDNVEWIGYPAGAKHVFCYAYYVVPPPTSGTIVVRKVVDDPAATADAVVPLPGRRLVRPGRDVRDRGVGRQAGLRDLLPRRRADLVVARAGPARVDEGRPVLPLGDRCESDPDRRRHRRGLGRSRGGGHGHVHAHRSARAAAVRPAAVQGHARWDRELRLRRVRARQRRPDHRDDRRRERRSRARS